MKKILALALALVTVLSLSVTAFAADEGSYQTEITYTKQASETPDPDPDPDPAPDPEPTITYTISIPRSITLAEDCTGTITIAPETVEIPDSKQVVVSLGSDGFDGDRFYIYSNVGEENEARIPLSFVYGKNYVASGDTVATFQNGGGDVSMIGIQTSPYFYQNAAAGTYTGNVRFVVSVQDK